MSGAGSGACCARIGADRWHFQHGPIDLIIHVDADAETQELSIAACWHEFQHILTALVDELPQLRRPAHRHTAVRGPVAARMVRACLPFAAERFITPMAAVAGAVADELIAALERPGIRRAFINNGGDIAVLLSPGTHYRVGVWSQPACALDAAFTVGQEAPSRGVATSGWRGRSFSLGIADSVTVLARDAAAADAAATLIANAVNCDSAHVIRAPASQLKDDTDLGDLLVTVDVPPLPAAAVAVALSAGRAEAERWQDRGLIVAAAILLQGRREVILPRAAAGLASAAA